MFKKIENTLRVLLTIYMFAILQACGVDVDSLTDEIPGNLTLTSLNGGEEIVSNFNITWSNDDDNNSSVVIELSSDSGQTYTALDPYIKQADTVACLTKPGKMCFPNTNDLVCNDIAGTDECESETGLLPDNGTYKWDTNSVTDCRNCRIRITATDSAKNISASVESTMDFVVNNVPQVLGSALYYDIGNDGIGADDRIIIPFDKTVELNTTVAGDVFHVPVAGDGFGPFSTVGPRYFE